ncbi:MAG: UDP-N-acetylmuramoyl-tripeptide--D-alanyl-D-alanine ligase [Longimicrobiales bacterium]|nr:UDP-N-acetylmuramoyl-tripeptide--D-alanyl-D-alanine ligase [Longimicrobiales bacterium]
MSTPSFTWTDAHVRAALGLPDAVTATTGGAAGGAAAPTASATATSAGTEPTYRDVSTDTRTLGPDALFVALRGPNFDGHDFLEAASRAGARGAVVERAGSAPAGMTLYTVPNTLVALGRLARYRRDRLPARVVALTGSSGKTTTRAFTEAALAGALRVHATERNLNNRIGVPLTLLAAPETAEVLVVEMGTSEPGEIRALVDAAHPDLGVVVTVSESHLDALGDLEGVFREKLDLIGGLDPSAQALVGDTPADLPRRARVIRPDVRVAGLGGAADPDLRPAHVEADAEGCYRFRWQGEPVSLRTPGRHMAGNAALALAVAQLLGVPAPAAARGVSGVDAVALRGETRRLGPLTLVADCYNANPQSTRASLDTLAGRTGSGPRVALLGTMRELGSHASALHDDVLAHALALGLDVVVATGAFADALPGARADALVRERDPEAALERILPTLREGGILLLKASRGERLERLIPRVEAEMARPSAAPPPAEGEG